jgi:alpha-amylase
VQILTVIDDVAPKDNETLFQAFEWYLPGPTHNNPNSGPSHYTTLEALLPHFAAVGISHLWLPPGCKAISVQDNGYGIYDLWDLGEFDAKNNGSPCRTKWGSKAELESFCAKANDAGINVIWDAVLNHKAAADEKETSFGVEVDSKDRTKVISKPHELETWTKFTFPGRGHTYSNIKYNWNHFSGVDYDSRTKDHGIFKFVADGNRSDWAPDVSKELGNYDYLMFADLDHSQTEVSQDIFDWATWITEHLNLGGMRFDAIKHYSLSFLNNLLDHLERASLPDKKLFFVGEYWDSNVENLTKVLKQSRGHLNLFDVQLVFNFSDYSKDRKRDLRKIFSGTLVKRDHTHAVVRLTSQRH